MTMTPELARQRPTTEQVDQIRRLSTVALGSAGAAFDTWGYPSTRAEASEIIRRINAQRVGKTVDEGEDAPDEKRCPDCGETKPAEQFYKNAAGPDGLDSYCKPCHDARASKPMEEEAMAETMECGRCKKTKPNGDFSASVQAKKTGWCRQCHSEYAKDRRTTTGNQGRVGSAPVVVSNTVPTISAAEPEPEPALSSNGEWRSQLANPTLARLRELQEALGAPSLDETALVCQLIAAART